MTRTMTGIVVLGLLATLFVGCSEYRSSGAASDPERGRMLETDAQNAILEFKANDPTINRFFERSAGYAVFPDVAKGGAGLGGAHGQGVLYEGGRAIGYTSLSQGTIGFQLGGQTFRQVIFFENERALGDFKSGNFEFSAQASAVAAAEGAAASADYTQGVAVFTMPKGGLMFEAAIGGQKFNYTPKNGGE